MDAEDRLKKALRNSDKEAIKDAFRRFYDENIRLVFRVLIDCFGKDDETEDDIQEAFLGLWKDPTKLKKIDHLTDYWISSAKYICGHRKKKQQRILQEADDSMMHPDPEIPKMLQGKDLFEKVERWLGHPDAEIVILRAAYGSSEKEIAERLGIGEDAVCYRYRKGIKELRRRLKNEEG